MSVRKLQSYFSTSAGLGALAERVAQLSELQRLWETLAPPSLAQMCRVGGVQDQVLVMYASNGAIAAKLRQLAPTMLEKFKETGVEVASIRVRVQVSFLPPVRTPVKSLRLGAAGAASLGQLAEQLSASSPLRRALEAILERHMLEDGASHENQSGEHK